MIVKLLIEGGDMKPGPAIAQKLGPMGINMGKVIQEVNKATTSFKGLKVPVELDVNPKTKNFTVKVFSPPTAELLKKELGIEAGSGDKRFKVGNLAIEQIISIAKTKLPNMFAKDLKAAVKTVVGSCVTLGILIDNKEAKEIEIDIDQGKYDKEIKEEKTTPSPEKVQKLKEYFEEVKKKQEEIQKKEEAAKAAEESAKAAAATAAPAAGTVPSTTQTPAPAATSKTPAKK